MRGDIGPAAPTPEDHFARAEGYSQAKNYAKAREELAAALALLAAEDRRRMFYFDGMGEAALAENDLGSAQAFYSDALKLGASLGLSDASVADAYAGMGFCLFAQGNFPFAHRYLDKALEFGPSLKTKVAIQGKLKELKKVEKERGKKP